MGSTVIRPSSVTCDVNNDGLLDGTSTEIRDFFDSDDTENFELGLKLTLLDNRMQINAAAYRTDWQGIPLTVSSGKLESQPAPICFSAVEVNAGEARSQGMEIEAIYQLTESLRIVLGAAYTDAELTAVSADVASTFSKGDRLPSAPESSANLGIEYDFELSSYPSYIRGDYAYVSDFYGVAGEQGQASGDYGQLNLSAGVSLDQFTIELSAHNLTDEDAFVHVLNDASTGQVYQLRPRTIGLTIGYNF